MKTRANGFWLLLCAGTLVAATVIAAILVMGAPSEQRKRRLDERRVQQLMEIERGVRLAYEREQRLPADLALLAGDAAMGLPLQDPATGSAYAYAPLGARTFSLCAQFATDTAVDSRSGAADDVQWRHPRGRHCFKFRVEESG